MDLFLACRTQWRVIGGMNGVVNQGLDYPALEVVMRMMNIKRKRRTHLFDDVRLMERGALEALAKQQNG